MSARKAIPRRKAEANRRRMDEDAMRRAAKAQREMFAGMIKSEFEDEIGKLPAPTIKKPTADDDGWKFFSMSYRAKEGMKPTVISSDDGIISIDMTPATDTSITPTERALDEITKSVQAGTDKRVASECYALVADARDELRMRGADYFLMQPLQDVLDEIAKRHL